MEFEKSSKSDKLTSKSKYNMSKGSKSKGSKSKKSESKSKPNAKSSKGIAKPKPKSKPYNPAVGSMSYTYHQYVSDCRCKKEFNDAMCGWCFTGNEKCVNLGCLDQCCYIQECKCNDHGPDICNRCTKEERGKNDGCPSEECTAQCCSLLETSAYPTSTSNKRDNIDIPHASVTVITQSYPATNGNADERFTEVSHDLFAVVGVGVVVGILTAVMGIVIRLRQVRCYIVNMSFTPCEVWVDSFFCCSFMFVLFYIFSLCSPNRM